MMSETATPEDVAADRIRIAGQFALHEGEFFSDGRGWVCDWPDGLPDGAPLPHFDPRCPKCRMGTRAFLLTRDDDVRREFGLAVVAAVEAQLAGV